VSFLIGVDEAGYGPNLGPLLLGATVWEVPGPPGEVDLYRQFAGVVSPETGAGESALVIADSKQVYSPGSGLGLLERGVGAALELCHPGAVPGDDVALVTRLAVGETDPWAREPWWQGGASPIPRHGRPANAGAWAERCRAAGIHLRALRIDLVSPERFNAWNDKTGSKGRTLSELSLGLVARCLAECQARETDAVLILADKHGGRNRYGEFLATVFGERVAWALEEGPQRSRYAAGGWELRFEVGSERYLPTALASMLAKYVRELAMERFNAYWQREVAGLRPTAGYPTDARRFRQEIESRRAALGIPERVIWREK